jgi:hypothetical protein
MMEFAVDDKVTGLMLQSDTRIITLNPHLLVHMLIHPTATVGCCIERTMTTSRIDVTEHTTIYNPSHHHDDFARITNHEPEFFVYQDQ